MIVCLIVSGANAGVEGLQHEHKDAMCNTWNFGRNMAPKPSHSIVNMHALYVYFEIGWLETKRDTFVGFPPLRGKA